MEVAVESTIPVSLDVRAVIPLSETQLVDPVQTLGLLFEPLAIGLHNLPNSFPEAGDFISALGDRGTKSFADRLSELLLDTEGNGFNSQKYDAWEGYSQTAGLNYDLVSEAFPPENQAVETGINVPGGIPALDAEIRPGVYDADGNFIPRDSGAQSAVDLPNYTWDGSFATHYEMAQQEGESAPEPDSQSVPDSESTPTESGNADILPTPTSP
jgi:hypothetical protein